MGEKTYSISVNGTVNLVTVAPTGNEDEYTVTLNGTAYTCVATEVEPEPEEP